MTEIKTPDYVIGGLTTLGTGYGVYRQFQHFGKLIEERSTGTTNLDSLDANDRVKGALQDYYHGEMKAEDIKRLKNKRAMAILGIIALGGFGFYTLRNLWHKLTS